ncbi:MAG TPA: ABC transporter substrate-binding protein [Stellaceae bacterium]|jgi:branched-chain amino acid transport system substrate-binding protein|nr:ABC transporter substrate-binding protein [Stellaceae bacterium]
MKFVLSAVAMAVGMVLAAGTAQADITVGFVTSLSGPGSSIGIPYGKGIDAAVEYADSVGGQKIKLIRLDDGSDPSTATRDARKLIEEDKVDILIGTATTPSSIAMVAVANELKVPMISVSPIKPIPGGDGWAISIVQPPPFMVSVPVDRMVHDGVKTVGFIGFSDAWGDLVYSGAKQAADAGRIKLVATERYSRTDTSVTGQAVKILAAHPDAVLIGGSGTQGALPILALTQLGYKGKFYGTPALLNADFIRVGGKAADGILVSAGPVLVAEQLPDTHYAKKISLAFRTAYQKATGKVSTDAFSPYAFDAWMLFVNAAQHALAKAQPGTAAFRAALKDAIFATKDFDGTNGIYNCHPGRIFCSDQRGLVLVRLVNGKWKYAP